MRAKDVMRLDTLVLLCVEIAERPPSSGEIADALGVAGFDVAPAVCSVILRALNDDGVIELVGYRLRFGQYRSRAYSLTPKGREVVNERREILSGLLDDPPQINDPDSESVT